MMMKVVGQMKEESMQASTTNLLNLVGITRKELKNLKK
jgi:hypothetical protein